MAGVALGVVGDMDDERTERGGDLLGAYGAGLFPKAAGRGCIGLRGLCAIGGFKMPDARIGTGESSIELVEKFDGSSWGFEFRLEAGNLRRRKRMAFCIREQAVYAASDVAEVEGDGRKPTGASVELSFGKGMAPVMEILVREF